MLLITVHQYLEHTDKTDPANAGFITRSFDIKAFASYMPLSESIERLWKYSNAYSFKFSVDMPQGWYGKTGRITAKQ